MLSWLLASVCRAFTARLHIDSPMSSSGCTLDCLRHATEQHSPGSHNKLVTLAVQAVVVGGGYIGMEVGSNISKYGIDTTLVYPEPHLMSRLFTPEIAEFYEKIYKEKGIHLKPESLATSFEGKDGKVRLILWWCTSQLWGRGSMRRRSFICALRAWPSPSRARTARCTLPGTCAACQWVLR